MSNSIADFELSGFDEPANDSQSSNGSERAADGLQQSNVGIHEPATDFPEFPPVPEPSTEFPGFEYQQPGPTEPGTGRIPGKRGRHPNGCSCPKCTERRARGTGPIPINTTEAAKVQANLATLEALFMSIHQMGAAFFKMPELALEKAEAKAISDAIKEVSKHRSVPLTEKAIADFNLGATLLTVYGTRAVALWKRKSDETPAPKLVNVTPIRPDKKTAATSAPEQKPNDEKPRILTPSEIDWVAPSNDRTF